MKEHDKPRKNMKTSLTYYPDESLLGNLAAAPTCTPEAFAELYQRYYGRVYNYMRYRCEDAATAEDLTAQLFERLLDRIGGYDPQRAPFAAWLFAIARNLVASHLRAQRRRAWLPLEFLGRSPSVEAGPEEAAVRREAHAELLSALATLDERERDLLGLKFAAQLNNRQIAELTGLSESNVGVILHRSMHRLRRQLVDTGEERAGRSGEER